MVRSLFNVFCLVFCLLTAHAQSVFKGRVVENKTHITLRAVSIENLNNKTKTTTGDDGRFGITAKVGDLLVLKHIGYQPDTTLLTDLSFKDLFIEPLRTQLKQVTITDSGTNAVQATKNMKYYDPQFHGQTMVYHRDKEKNFDGGIILRMHYFTGDDNKKKKAKAKEQRRILSEEISAIFSADNISYYLPLKGADLDDFLVLYTPDIKVYNNAGFNLLAYLSTSYETFLTLDANQRKAGQIFKKR